MTLSLFSKRGAGNIDNEASVAATSPSLYDAVQFYDGSTWIGNRVGGQTLTLPAGLPIGWRMRAAAGSAPTSAVTVALNAAYTSVFAPNGAVGPFTLLPGTAIDIEVVAATAILITPAGGSALGGGITNVATRTALSTIAASARFDGMLAQVLTDNSLWRFNATSTAAADYTGTAAVPLGAVTSANLVIVPTAGAGRWIRADKTFVARYAFVQATADNVALCTVPVGMALRVLGLPYIDFTAVVAGDNARRVGASGSFGAFGGNAGDFIGSTQPVAGPVASTLGADFAAAVGDTQTFVLYQTCLIREGETITYDILVPGTGTADGMICVPVSLETPTQTMIS